MLKTIFEKKHSDGRISLPIRSVLIIPFLFQVILAVGVIGWLSIRNARRAVNDISEHLRKDISSHIEEKLEGFLSTPHLLNELNSNAIALEQIDYQNLLEVHRHFYQQADQFEDIQSIFLALENGFFIGNGSFDNNRHQIMISDRTNNGSIRFYDINSQGEAGELLKEVPNFDTKNRPWYRVAIEADQSVWGDVFTYHAYPLMAIPAIKPLYNSEGNFFGLLGNNYFLTQISEYLSSLDIGLNGQAFIIERTGMLIASSTLPEPFNIEEGILHRINIADIQDPIVQSMVDRILESHTDFERIPQSKQYDFWSGDEKYFLGVSPYSDEWGLDWLVLIVIPESDFLAQIIAHKKLTILISIVAVCLAILLALLTSRWISKPILQLSEKTHKIAKDLTSSRLYAGKYVNLDRKLGETLLREISNLSNSFVSMIDTLDRTLLELENSNLLLEQKVEQRTEEIKRALDHESTLIRITDSVRESLSEDNILKTVVREIALAFHVPYCSTGIYNLSSQTSKIAHEYTDNFYSYLGHSIDMGNFPYRYNQLKKFQYILACEINDRSEHGSTAGLMLPISDRMAIYGDIYILADSERVFSESEIRLAQQIASQCAIAIRQARLYRASQVRAEELDTLHTLKDDFLSTVSHELRSPMSSIKMAAEMLEVSLNKQGYLSESSHPVSRYLNILQAESDREICLINDLLDLARLDDDSFSLNIKEVYPSQLIFDISESFSERARTQHQILKIDIPDNLPIIHTDAHYLQRILAELLHNACKYTPQDERIEVSVRKIMDNLCIRVSNTGVSISQAQCDLVFNKFYRIPNNDPWKHGGTGLGLALVKKIADTLKIDIAVECINGEFSFSLIFDLTN